MLAALVSALFFAVWAAQLKRSEKYVLQANTHGWSPHPRCLFGYRIAKSFFRHAKVDLDASLLVVGILTEPCTRRLEAVFPRSFA